VSTLAWKHVYADVSDVCGLSVPSNGTSLLDRLQLPIRIHTLTNLHEKRINISQPSVPSLGARHIIITPEAVMTTATPQVRVGVGVFVVEKDSSPSNPRFLVGKRKGSHGAGFIALPGGHLEFGETTEACAAREVEEETGLRVSNVRFLNATNDYMRAEGKHYVTLFVTCVRDDGSQEARNLEPDKCEGWEWVCWEDLRRWIDDDGVNVFLPLVNFVPKREGKVPLVS
jgi:8-oxo-dGTP diphosphatase